MKTAEPENRLIEDAIEALRAVLGSISSIEVTELKCVPPGQGRAEILAQINVLGRIHTLECEVNAHENPQQLRMTERSSESGAADGRAESTRVIIAPYLSPEEQARCKETNTCFVDLEGNARIALGEIFIGKRTMQPHKQVESNPKRIDGTGKRSLAPMVYIASNIPGSPVRVGKNAPAGVAVA
jgi:hypothetical protein